MSRGGALGSCRLGGSWPPAVRLAAAGIGGLLMARCARRPSSRNVILGTLGFGLTLRAVTNVDARRLLGFTGRRGIDFQKTINIVAPLEAVFDLWSRLDNLPFIMPNVREVHDLGDHRSHWVVAGPMGVPVHWNAVTTRKERNRCIAWRTEKGSPVAHAGIVRFTANDDGSTRIDVRMTYSPPTGAAGHVAMWLFRADPKRQMDEALLRMKSFLETGVVPHDSPFLTAPLQEK